MHITLSKIIMAFQKKSEQNLEKMGQGFEVF